MEKKFNASVDAVYALLTNGKWLEARCLALGELSAMCKAKKTAGGLTLTMQRRVHRDLPAMVAKVLSPDSDIEVIEHWAGDAAGHTGSYTLSVIGKPITVTADFSLEPAGKGCVYKVQHTAKVKIPLVGGVVEKFVLAETEKGCADELEYLAADLKAKK